MVLIRGGAPHDPSQRTTLADPRLPEDLALLVRIQRVDDAGFLPGNQDTLSAAQGHQDRRLTEVVIGTIAFRTVDPVTNEARGDVAVVRGKLPMPEHPAGRKIERKNRIAGFRGRVGIIVPCRDIERLTLHVDGRRGPHRRAGRTMELGPHGIPLGRTRGLGDGVALPDLLARRNIQRDDTAAKGAALIGGRRPDGFLPRRNRHIQNAGIQGWRTGDHRRRMILHLRLPEQCARDRIHGVGIGAQIAEKHGKLVGTGDRGKTDRGSNVRLGLERPAGASGFGVERVDLVIAAPDK